MQTVSIQPTVMQSQQPGTIVQAAPQTVVQQQTIVQAAPQIVQAAPQVVQTACWNSPADLLQVALFDASWYWYGYGCSGN